MMLLLILVVGTYLVFTNSIQGKMKLIMIVFCIVVGLYLFLKLPAFKNYNEVLSSPQSAKSEYSLVGSELKKTDGPIGLSTWIYIDNWNYKYGEEKTIIDSENKYFPKITLGAYKNDITVSVNVYGDEDTVYSIDQLRSALDNSEVSYSESEDLSCNGGSIEKDGVLTDVACPSGGPEDVEITNVNIQKWVNLLVTFNNRTMDVYMNGKLIKSTPFNNIIASGGIFKNDIKITPYGGFGGFVSKTQYYPYFITPAKAWSIYRGGFGDAFESSLNKYNLSVSFYEDSVERNKYFVF